MTSLTECKSSSQSNALFSLQSANSSWIHFHCTSLFVASKARSPTALVTSTLARFGFGFASRPEAEMPSWFMTSRHGVDNEKRQAATEHSDVVDDDEANDRRRIQLPLMPSDRLMGHSAMYCTCLTVTLHQIRKPLRSHQNYHFFLASYSSYRAQNSFPSFLFADIDGNRGI